MTQVNTPLRARCESAAYRSHESPGMRYQSPFAAPLALAAALLAVAALPSAAEQTRSIMDQVFDAIAYLLPRTMSREDLAARGSSELVADKLAVLSASADALVEHTRDRETEFRLLARSFDRNVKDVKYAFDEGNPAFAFYALMDLTEHCVACHTRLPDDRNFTFGQRLMARMDVDALDRTELAQLYAATRQFDESLNVLERELLDPATSPVDADLEGTFIDYLDVSISVLQDFERPRAFLGRYLERGDLPFYLRRRFEIWRNSMQALSGDLKAPPSLTRARAIFRAATDMTLVPSGGERAVHDVLAASILRRLLETRSTLSAQERAEAYYMLGLIALRTTEVRAAVPEMELLLEAAIRSAPKGPLAEDAFSLLEEYGFINDLPLANDGRETPLIDLAALRKLIED